LVNLAILGFLPSYIMWRDWNFKWPDVCLAVGSGLATVLLVTAAISCLIYCSVKRWWHSEVLDATLFLWIEWLLQGGQRDTSFVSTSSSSWTFSSLTTMVVQYHLRWMNTTRAPNKLSTLSRYFGKYYVKPQHMVSNWWCLPVSQNQLCARKKPGL
jgi:hypothetical protein